MGVYIHKPRSWPVFHWDQEKLVTTLTAVRYRQGWLGGHLETGGPSLRSAVLLQTLTLDTLKSAETEGIVFNPGEVRSSLARRLGLEIAGPVHTAPQVERAAGMILDSTLHYDKPLSAERISGWHTALSAAGQEEPRKVSARDWHGHGKRASPVHYESADTGFVKTEMSKFLQWFNKEMGIDPVVKAAIAHRWFLAIHPFDEGNGRIARAIADMQLSRAGGGAYRCYSMSAQICRERGHYYTMVESTKKVMPDITVWLEWFLACLERSFAASDGMTDDVLRRTRFRERHETASFNERQRRMIGKLMDGSAGRLVSSRWAEMTKCSQDTALRDIQDLLERGILIKDSAGGRSTGYLLKEQG
jgi:Fic family protein